MNVNESIKQFEERERILLEITSSLSKTTNLDTLLEEIVTRLCEVTDSDAGSLYILEGADKLKFAVAQNKSKQIPFKSFTLPLSETNIAGHVALSGKPIRHDDVYELPTDAPYKFNAEFDKKFNYRAKSMLAVPLKNRAGKVVGVVQLINRKKSESLILNTPEDTELCVIPYTEDDVEFLTLLASQAAIAIERQSLYDGIERLLRGIVESSARSIESRDRVTSGHSQRIAAYLVVLAKRMTKHAEATGHGKKFASEAIRELFIAGMLHDIGKIGVPEYLLNKQNKLTDNRLDVIRKRIQIEIMHDPSKREYWDDIISFIEDVNIPGFLDDARLARLEETAKLTVRDIDGNVQPLFEQFELDNLLVRRGNLTNDERKMIEKHVVQSEEILSAIPWTDDLKNVPIIAGSHHEKPNGKGYPKGLQGDDVPYGGKMLSVVDVFEALTAMDRPYKRAMPIERALEILRSDSKVGALDPDIVEFFIEQKCYGIITDDMRKKFNLSADEILALE